MTKNIQIPPIFIFTHYVNLLQTDFNVNAPFTTTTTITTTTVTTTTVNDSNVQQTNRKQHLNLQERYTKEELQELRVLQENVFRIIALHNNNNNNNNNNTTLVRFLTDQDCIHSIRQWAYISAQRNPARLLSLQLPLNHNTTIRTHDGSSIHPQHHHHPTGDGNSNTSDTRQQNAVDDAADAIANELISYFQNERTGMYKADLCRGVALYETGGIYMDIDLGIRMNLYDVLLDTSEFVTVKVHTQSHYPGAFFQAFIAAVPYHDVIHRYIELFLLYYRRIVIIEKGPIGVILLKRAYDEIQYEQEQQLLQLQQKEGTMISVSTTTTSTHLQQTTELWQEVLYLPQYHETIFRHVPIPTWGNNKRACKFVVVIPPTHQRRQGHKTTTTDDDDDNKNNSKNSATNTSNVKLIVPMYSRIAGSRMCPKIT